MAMQQANRTMDTQQGERTMAVQLTHKQSPTGTAVIERQIDQAETFLHALETDSLLSLNISFKHAVEYDYSVYDQLSEDLIEPDVLKRYLRRYLQSKLEQLKQQNGRS